MAKDFGSRKGEIIERVRQGTPKGSESEGTFVKQFLAPLSREVLGRDGVAIEGLGSNGLTQFKKSFFNAKPAPDFVARQLGIVGEAKYGKLTPRALSTGIGQALLYSESSKQEGLHLPYSVLVYFANHPNAVELKLAEQEFINLLWERDSVFTIVI